MSVPVLSWPFTVRGKPGPPQKPPAKGAPKEAPAFYALRPTGTQQSALAARAARADRRQPAEVWTQTPEPDPQSQSFSRSYGSVLPTSLTYIVLSTRGCSPWRPDAVMSTTERDEYSLLRIFKDRRGRTGHRKTCDALPTAGPYLRVMRFQGGRVVKKKRKLFPGLPPVSPDSVALPPTPTSRFGNIDPIPFRCTARIAPLTQDCPIS